MEKRRASTVIRDNLVHSTYKEVCDRLGEYAILVPKAYIYNKVMEKTGLCAKTIAFILNHTFPVSRK